MNFEAQNSGLSGMLIATLMFKNCVELYKIE